MKIEKNEKKLKEIFTNYFKEAPEDKSLDLTKNKWFINAILSTQENKDKLYKKFDWIHTYFTQTEKFQNWAKDKQFKNKSKEKSEDKENTGVNIETKDNSKKIKKHDKEFEKEDKPKVGLFGALAGGDKNEEENKGASLFQQFKKKAENFDFSQLRGGNIDTKTKSKIIHDTEKENKEFNNLLRGFINDFDEIVTIDNILDNIRIVDYFTRE